MIDNGLILVLLGFVAYFCIEFKSRQAGGPKASVGYWLKDNWYNILFTGACVSAYYLIMKPTGTMSTMTIVEKVGLFALGLMPNYFVDKLMDLVKKYTAKPA